jgi:hypothetical protein
MNKQLFTLYAIAALIVANAIFFKTEAAQIEKPASQKWEYADLLSTQTLSEPTKWSFTHGNVTDGTSRFRALNVAGDQGWELVGLSSQNATTIYYLKRPKQ